MRTHIPKILRVLACLAGTAAAFILLFSAQPAKAADTYQKPCFPYGNPDYYFGQYVSGWGYHVGEDVCHQAGTPEYAVADGVVVYSARTPDSYRWGNLIMIEHRNPGGDYAVSLYGHMDDNRLVAAGQSVGKGQLIGYVGPQGPANGNWGPHLHFGIHPGRYGASVGTYAAWVHGYENPCCGGWVNPQDYVNLRLRSYDSVPIDTQGNNWMYYNSSTQITFRYRNTGANTWYKDGSNPTRLGTVNYRDRRSGFSSEGTAPGWAGANRIKLNADTPTGGVGSFTATFTSNHAPGNYLECFSPLVEGNQWLPERPLCPWIQVLPPSWRGEWYNQMVTTSFSPTGLTGQTDKNMYMLPDDKVNVKIFIKNTGELDWQADGPNPVKLAPSRPADRSSSFVTTGNGGIPASENWLSANRASGLDGRYDPSSNSVVADSLITNGEIGVFSFTATAKDLPGSYQEYFNAVVEGKMHMPDIGIWIPFRILDRGYHYQYVTQTQVPSSVGTTTTYQDVTLQVRNTGRQTWPVGGALRLATDRPRDNQSAFYTPSGTGAWLAPNRAATVNRNVSVTNKSTVDPGEIAEFSFRLTVPLLPAGTYRAYFHPVLDGVAWLPEDYGIHFPITITAPPLNYQVLKQTFSGNIQNFPRNSTMTASLAVKNTGRETWAVSGANAVRLGTSRPMDRSSGFAVLTGGDPWLGLNRPSAIDGRVTDLNSLTTVSATEIKPGETALFQFGLKANPPAGTYNEYFNLVKEGATWLTDYGIFFPLTVTNP